MALKVKNLLQELEKIAPKSFAEEWDNVGLLVGSMEAEVRGIYVCLDIDMSILHEAIAKGCNVILSHHPVIFKPLAQIHYDEPQGKILSLAIQNNLHLIAAHTNYDKALFGVSYQLAQKIGLENIKVLIPDTEKLYKLVVFTPQGYEEIIRKALGDAGAGHIGNYSHCTFGSPGTGTFLPLEGTNPFIGATGQLEKVAEIRVETIVPHSILSNVLKAMLDAHPYEEVAYDLIPLANEKSNTGLGCIGELVKTISLSEFTSDLKTSLGVNTLKIAGELAKPVKKIAVCGGSGKIALSKAIALGADVLVTGELGYHDAQLAREYEVALIDAGHFATEHLAMPYLASVLQKQFSDSLAVPVIVAKNEEDLWKFM